MLKRKAEVILGILGKDFGFETNIVSIEILDEKEIILSWDNERQAAVIVKLGPKRVSVALVAIDFKKREYRIKRELCTPRNIALCIVGLQRNEKMAMIEPKVNQGA